MGIIQRQGIKNTISTYLGFFIGFINLLIIQPYFLTPEEIGLTRLLFSFSFLLSLFVPLGVTNLTTKYFPHFRNDENGHFGFLGFILLFPLIGFLIISVLLYVFKDFIISQYVQQSKLFVDYYLYIFPLTFILSLIGVINSYAFSLYKTTVPTFLNDVVTRIFSIILFSVYFLKLISLNWMIVGFVSIYFLQLVLLITYILMVDNPKLKFDLAYIKSRNLNEMFFYSSLLAIASIASLGIKYMDAIFIGKYLPLGLVGIYSVAAFVPNIIETPLYALERITMPKISHSLAIDDINAVKEIYDKNIKIVMLVGLLLFIGVNTNIDDLLKFLPQKYNDGGIIVNIISLSALFNLMAAGTPSIIFNSRLYKVGVLLLIALSFSAFFLNILLIPTFELTGAALATLLSLAFYAIARIMIVWKKYNLHPFNRTFFLIIIISTLIYLFVELININTGNLIINIIIKSLITLVLFIVGLLKFKLVNEYLILLPENVSSLIKKYQNRFL